MFNLRSYLGFRELDLAVYPYDQTCLAMLFVTARTCGDRPDHLSGKHLSLRLRVFIDFMHAHLFAPPSV